MKFILRVLMKFIKNGSYYLHVHVCVILKREDNSFTVIVTPEMSFVRFNWHKIELFIVLKQYYLL